MKMYIGGKWIDASEQIEVINPFDNSIIDTIPKATPGNISEAISSAVRGNQIWPNYPDMTGIRY